MKIRIYYENVNFRLRKSGSIKEFLEKVIRKENKIPCDLNFIFTDDENLIEISRKYLGHDYFTDVVAFDYSEGKTIKGEIYISIDTVRANAKYFGLRVNEEVLRVMIHGILHLCGYDDKEKGEKEKMLERQEMKVREFLI